MAHYIIGDVHGCMNTLNALLDKINFDASKDYLYFCGDVIARGEHSLEVIRFIRSLGKHAQMVLGNHELHHLAAYNGFSKIKKRDKTQALIDCDEHQAIYQWLLKQPLLIHHQPLNFVITHAGIPPCWDLTQAKAHALEVEHYLQRQPKDLLAHIYANTPDNWSDDLQGIERYRFIINCFTRMRYCIHAGHLELTEKSPPQQAPSTLTPWFLIKHRKNIDAQLFFGHWAALQGYIEGNFKGNLNPQIVGLDTGCVWGEKLSAFHIEEKKLISVDSIETC